MDWVTMVALALWCFSMGTIFGAWTKERRLRGAVVLGEIFLRAVKETRDVELFAGMGSVSQATVRDGLGKDWVITIERAGQ